MQVEAACTQRARNRKILSILDLVGLDAGAVEVVESGGTPPSVWPSEDGIPSGGMAMVSLTVESGHWMSGTRFVSGCSHGPPGG